MPTPINSRRRVDPPSGAALPDGDCPLDSEAVAAILTHRVREDVRKVQPAVRGVAVHQSWRDRGIRKGMPYSASNLLALLGDLVCDPRYRTDDICAVLHGIELEVRALRGECDDTTPWHDVMAEETAVEGMTNITQWQAARARSTGVLYDLAALLMRQASASKRAAVVTLREAQRAGPPTAA